jgi:hypothetical protein
MRYLLEDTCVRLAKNMSFGRGDGFPAIVLTDRRGDTRPGRQELPVRTTNSTGCPATRSFRNDVDLDYSQLRIDILDRRLGLAPHDRLAEVGQWPRRIDFGASHAGSSVT